MARLTVVTLKPAMAAACLMLTVLMYGSSFGLRAVLYPLPRCQPLIRKFAGRHSPTAAMRDLSSQFIKSTARIKLRPCFPFGLQTANRRAEIARRTVASEQRQK